jgi:hypothetical protein
MATTLKQLERRVSAVEKKLAKLMKESKTAPTSLRKNNKGSQSVRRNGKKAQREASTPLAGWAAIAKPGSWLAHQLAIQPEIKKLAAQVFEEMGITGEPTDPRIIREKMIERGVKPEDNEFTRELIRMREET